MRNPFSLEGKVAIVTGAASGIGYATAAGLATAGAAVLMTDINAEACRKAASQLQELGFNVSSLGHDASSESDWKNAVNTAVDIFAGLDVLVNNAGIYQGGTLLSNTLEEVQRVTNVNVSSVFLGMKYAAQIMKPSGRAGKGGSIVNLSSVAGLVGVPGHSAYGSTKGAVRLYTKHAAAEFGFMGTGIRVNSIHPGPINTAMGDKVFEDLVAVGMAPDVATAREQFKKSVPLGRVGEPQDVANMVVFLASDASSYCTGCEFVVDGGISSV